MNAINYERPILDMVGTGRNIKSIRRSAGFSVRELQEYLGFEYPQTIYNWERGDNMPSIDNLLAMSILFNVTVNDILVTTKGAVVRNTA